MVVSNHQRPKPRTKYAGVYAIRYIPTERMYVGGSADITGRYTHHRFMLRRGKHKCSALQDAWNQYGEDQFSFETLERCDPEHVREREEFWHQTSANTFNTIKEFFFRGKRGPSAKVSAAAVRRWNKPEYRAKRANFLATRRAGRFIKQDQERGAQPARHEGA
jgi:group I intron endonuclease